MVNKIASIALLLIAMVTVSAQDKKIDKLEMLYDQGNFKVVQRKAYKLRRKEEYKNSPQVFLFETLSKFQIEQIKGKTIDADVLLDYEDFVSMDSTNYFQSIYANYIYDLQIGLSNEIRALASKNPELAKVRYDTYNRLFSNTADYTELTAATPINIDKPVTDEIPVNVTSAVLRDNILAEARKHLGIPYSFGGTTVNGFDCSGYTQYVFAKNDISLPRTASAQGGKYKSIKTNKAMPGDLICFGRNKNNITHIGIVTSKPGEDLTMIHASSSRGIMISNVENNSYWKPKLIKVVRVIE